MNREWPLRIQIEPRRMTEWHRNRDIAKMCSPVLFVLTFDQYRWILDNSQDFGLSRSILKYFT